MRSRKINEGLFKEVEKTIIDQDDPDYVEKDRERMFNNIKEREEKIKRNVVIEWICNYVRIYIEGCPSNKYTVRNDRLTPADENIYFDLHLSDSNEYEINLHGDSTSVNRQNNSGYVEFHIALGPDCSSPFTNNGELPYKFNTCYGDFMIDATASAARNQIKSYKNIPIKIEGLCALRPGSVDKVNRTNMNSVPISTLPEGLSISDSLSLYNVTDLTGMPKISVGDTLFIDGTLKTMEGWNPSATVGNLVVNNALKTLKGLPDGFSCHDLKLSHNEITEIKDWPKNLNIDGILDISFNSLTAESLRVHPIPRDISVKFFILGVQYDLDSNGWHCISKSQNNPVLIPEGIKDFSIWSVDGDGKHISELKYGFNKSYWMRAKRVLPKNKLDEGLFKEIDQTLIDQDDPDYIEKDRERMFNTFKEKDRFAEELNNVKKWVCGNIWIVDYTPGPNYNDYRVLTMNDDDVYFEVVGNNIRNLTINFLNGGCRYYLQHDNSNPNAVPLTNSNGEIPYKIDYCKGHFVINDSTYDGDRNLGLVGLRSFKNTPAAVGGSYEIIIGGGANDNSERISIATLPSGLTVGQQLYLSCNIKSLTGMPDNIKANELNLSYNNNLVNLEGWNPTTKVKALCICACNSFKSLKGLPDGFKCEKLSLYNNNITEIKNWPKNLTITDELVLIHNMLTLDSLREHPLPVDLKCGHLRIDNQYPPDTKVEDTKKVNFAPGHTMVKARPLSKDTKKPLPIPAGVGRIAIWASEDIQKNPKYNKYWKRMEVPSVNEGFFKKIEQTIINPDDPNYVEKDREKMFNAFKAADAKKKKIAEVQKWLATYMSVFDWTDKNDLQFGPRLSERFDGSLYRINFREDDTEFEDPEIELGPVSDDQEYSFKIFDIRMGIDAEKTGKPSPYVNGKLPYRFGKCYGSFCMRNDALSTVEKFTSLENIPHWISGDCRLNHGELKDLSTMPKGLTVGRELDLTKNGITSLNGMPDDIKCEKLNLSFNNLTDCTGWNPTTRIEESLIITNCGYFKSIKGLPDDFSLNGTLNLANNHIENMNGWPEHLQIGGDIKISGNYLDGTAFPKYPYTVFPADWKCSGRIDCTYQCDANGTYMKNLDIRTVKIDDENESGRYIKMSDYVKPKGCQTVQGFPYIKYKEEMDYFREITHEHVLDVAPF